jgi:hypothetical protein
VNVLDTVNVKVDASTVLAFFTVTLAEAALAESVTVNPPSMVASSPAIGALAPEAPPEVADQVEVDDQFPLATENREAAKTLLAVNTSMMAAPKKAPARRENRPASAEVRWGAASDDFTGSSEAGGFGS